MKFILFFLNPWLTGLARPRRGFRLRAVSPDIAAITPDCRPKVIAPSGLIMYNWALFYRQMENRGWKIQLFI